MSHTYEQNNILILGYICLYSNNDITPLFFLLVYLESKPASNLVQYDITENIDLEK